MIFGVDMKVVGDDGRELPWDGKSGGNLHVRGPWVINWYFRKDEIKSGGEWISSIDLENVMMSHPQQRVLRVRIRSGWSGRWCVLRPGATVTREKLLAFYDGKVAKWWKPDDVVFADELPYTATGKLQKFRLRELYREHVLPTVDEKVV